MFRNPVPAELGSFQHSLANFDEQEVEVESRDGSSAGDKSDEQVPEDFSMHQDEPNGHHQELRLENREIYEDRIAEGLPYDVETNVHEPVPQDDLHYDNAISPDESSYEPSTWSIQSAPAILAESRDALYDHIDDAFSIRSIGQPYSIPDPYRWQDVAKWKWKNILRRQSLSTLPPSTWHADAATRPLLLTFDAFDTLFTPSQPIAQQYREVAGNFGLDLSEEDIMQSFKKSFKYMNAEHPNYGKDTGMDPSSWWTQLIDATLSPLLPAESPSLPADLPLALYDRFSSSTGYQLFPDVLPFLSLIGSSSYAAGIWPPRRTMLGIISNSDPRVHSILSSFGIAISPSLFPPRYSPHSRLIRRAYDFGPAHFAFATLSYDAGFAKPDRKIFDQAVRDAQNALDVMHPVAKLTRTGGDVVKNVYRSFHHMHIGDDVEKDVLPALECGWDAVLLDRNSDHEITTREIDGRQVTVINNLMALPRLVTKERLELNGGQKPVWLDLEGRGPVVAKPPKGRARTRKTIMGRRIVEHPLSTVERPFKMLE